MTLWQPFLLTDLWKSLFLAAAVGHCGHCKADKAVHAFWALSSADISVYSRVRLNWYSWKGLGLFTLHPTCLGTQVGEEATEETKPGKKKNKTPSTIKLSIISTACSFSFQTLSLLQLVKDQLSIKNYLRWIAEDSTQDSSYEIKQTGLFSSS